MKRFAKVLVALAILALGLSVSALLWVTRPQAERNDPVEVFPVVTVQPVRYQSVAFKIPSQGLVEATRRSRLSAEVAGKVIEVNPLFKTGNPVAEGTWLVRIDPTDYDAARAQAASNLENARAVLAAEEARVEQAKRDWRKLGSGEASDLTLRGPQIRSARAAVESAEAALEKTEADRRRAIISAPFDGVLASTHTEVGSYLTPGAEVAEIFETRYEVRLPVSVDQLQFLEFDEEGQPTGIVDIAATYGGATTLHPARLVRSEGEVDRSSRSVYLVAEIVATEKGSRGIQPGLFVKATIRGRPIPNRAPIPFPAFVDLERVAVVAPDDTLQFRDVEVVFRNEDAVYISGGLEEGELLCLTELPAKLRGQRVSPQYRTTEATDATHEDEPAPKPRP